MYFFSFVFSHLAPIFSARFKTTDSRKGHACTRTYARCSMWALSNFLVWRNALLSNVCNAVGGDSGGLFSPTLITNNVRYVREVIVTRPLPVPPRQHKPPRYLARGPFPAKPTVQVWPQARLSQTDMVTEHGSTGVRCRLTVWRHKLGFAHNQPARTSCAQPRNDDCCGGFSSFALWSGFGREVVDCACCAEELPAVWREGYNNVTLRL